MAEIILVRHGQANSAATDEESYDRLSDVGHQQARWLGDHWRDQTFDHVISGDMRRHLETAAGIGVTPETDPRWNELGYFALSDALRRLNGTPHPEPGENFVQHVDQVFDHWRRDALPDVPETYAAFEGRILAALNAVADRGGRSLVVTSTGVISIVLQHVLHLTHAAHMKVLVQTRNTSVHKIERLRGTFYVAEYGGVPHLEAPDRAPFRTHY